MHRSTAVKLYKKAFSVFGSVTFRYRTFRTTSVQDDSPNLDEVNDNVYDRFD